MDTYDIMDVIITSLEESDRYIKSVKKTDVPGSRTIIVVDVDGDIHDIFVS